MTRVFKFGGALIRDAKGIENLGKILADYSSGNLVLVVSAIGKTTNALEELVKRQFSNDLSGVEKQFVQIRRTHFELAESVFDNAHHHIYDLLDEQFTALNETLKRAFENRYFAYDQIVGFGERFSTTIIQSYLEDHNFPLTTIDSSELIHTDNNYTAARLNWKKTVQAIKEHVSPELSDKSIVLTQGFTGADEKGHPTTLGREGSDFTAAILANALEADEVTIWKDVPGLMNADPNRFSDTIKLDKISYHEAIELAFYGASVIHPKTIQPVQQKNIPLFIRSFYQPESSPTTICNDTSWDDKTHKIIVKDNQVLLSIASRSLTFIAEENLTQIFEAFARHKIHINLMQHSAVSFSVCFDNDEAKLSAILCDLKNDFKVRYNTELQLITIRFYSDELIKKLTEKKQVFLEQKSRTVVQLLVR